MQDPHSETTVFCLWPSRSVRKNCWYNVKVWRIIRQTDLTFLDEYNNPTNESNLCSLYTQTFKFWLHSVPRDATCESVPLSFLENIIMRTGSSSLIGLHNNGQKRLHYWTLPVWVLDSLPNSTLPITGKTLMSNLNKTYPHTGYFVWQSCP